MLSRNLTSSRKIKAFLPERLLAWPILLIYYSTVQFLHLLLYASVCRSARRNSSLFFPVGTLFAALDHSLAAALPLEVWPRQSFMIEIRTVRFVLSVNPASDSVLVVLVKTL